MSKKQGRATFVIFDEPLVPVIDFDHLPGVYARMSKPLDDVIPNDLTPSDTPIFVPSVRFYDFQYEPGSYPRRAMGITVERRDLDELLDAVQNDSGHELWLSQPELINRIRFLLKQSRLEQRAKGET